MKEKKIIMVWPSSRKAKRKFVESKLQVHWRSNRRKGRTRGNRDRQGVPIQEGREENEWEELQQTGTSNEHTPKARRTATGNREKGHREEEDHGAGRDAKLCEHIFAIDPVCFIVCEIRSFKFRHATCNTCKRSCNWSSQKSASKRWARPYSARGSGARVYFWRGKAAHARSDRQGKAFRPVQNGRLYRWAQFLFDVRRSPSTSIFGWSKSNETWGIFVAL